ncbi:MAG: hypothetical protein H0W64_07825 [Gammaproteobacteria bacterium]|nr:hypothetical protein [Gammaproteobacteria bacterium]
MLLNIPSQFKLLIALCCVLATFVILAVVYTGLEWYRDWQLAKQPLPALAVTTPRHDKMDPLESLPNTHLFGTALVAVTQVPLSRSQFQLTGIVKNMEEAETSKAYIALNGMPTKIYRIGDTLPYGGKIYDITPDTVILQNDGQLEKLLLTRESLVFKSRNEDVS